MARLADPGRVTEAICGVTVTREWAQNGWSFGSGSSRKDVERRVPDASCV
jgi:hypothetical protein